MNKKMQELIREARTNNIHSKLMVGNKGNKKSLAPRVSSYSSLNYPGDKKANQVKSHSAYAKERLR